MCIDVDAIWTAELFKWLIHHFPSVLQKVQSYKDKQLYQKTDHMFAWETSDGAWCCKCGVVPLWWAGGVAASREMNSDTGVQPHSQVGCSRISTWSCFSSGCAAPRSTSKPQICLGVGWGCCIQQPAPDLAPGLCLYALAASQPPRSRQTRKHTNRFVSSYRALIMYPAHSHSSANTSVINTT